jgi:hypothetical protein
VEGALFGALFVSEGGFARKRGTCHQADDRRIETHFAFLHQSALVMRARRSFAGFAHLGKDLGSISERRSLSCWESSRPWLARLACSSHSVLVAHTRCGIRDPETVSERQTIGSFWMAEGLVPATAVPCAADAFAVLAKAEPAESAAMAISPAAAQ